MLRSNSRILAIALGGLFTSVSLAPAQTGSEYLRSNPQFLQAFRELAQKANQSIVRIQCDGSATCLGVVVGADGWVLTKAHDLTGRITCRMKTGQEFEPRLVGVHEANDLALLKIDARLLKPIAWSRSDQARAGSWVASIGPGEDPLAVGVVSVATRKVQEAYLGLQVEPVQEGLLVLNIFQKSPALKAGIRPKDIILRVDGQSVTEPEMFAQLLAGHRPGDILTLSIRRAGADKDFHPTLQSREQLGDFRAEFQNRLGGELSNRRSGYAVMFQHDSVLKPRECGSVVVDLQGRVIGMNISRAGRVETWALPAEIIEPLIPELKSGRLAPKEKKSASN